MGEISVLIEDSLANTVYRSRQPWREKMAIKGESGFARGDLPLTNGAGLPKLRAASRFARLFVIFAFPQFFLNAASLQQFLEPAQSQADRLSFVNTHPQGHVSSTS
jgi:hypothetical protein